MAATRTDIGNHALRRLGISSTMTDVDTDTSTRAKAIRAELDHGIELLMSEFPWPMAHRYVELGLVGGTASAPYNDDYTFAYRYATTCMKLLRVIEEDGGDRNPSERSEIPYRIVSDTSGRLILTDQEDAEAEVIALPEEGQYPAKFVEALSIKVAMLAGPALMGETKRAVNLEHDYETALSLAKVAAANEAQHELRPDTPAIRARRGGIRRVGGDVELE